VIGQLLVGEGAASEDSGVVTVAGDIADPETAQRVVGEAIERVGRIDTLINNAGIFIGKPFTDYTPEDFNALVAVNLAGFFHITTRTIKHMLDKGRGHVVNEGPESVARWKAIGAHFAITREIRELRKASGPKLGVPSSRC
jgi:NAD(P)-dependent dehydrogenase (short-subunit alcohol dehydrogenase family)